ncbi:hypothetical protein SAMN05920897_10356 [Alkalispirochaeta americana]|uniref:DUF2802 domain-containing protein n=1 Tax=Alkalispirochaeta americana TaxID=159291 RepID=A0A1N6PNG5_9SPIO|nr:hypothetical protein [Alkalispirochaeta americana]SIQ05749.1 hypothetical protein SAMN05920897_10356 [Alkalispirochaeta americana]
MTIGMYVLTTGILFFGFALWLRGVVIARVRPERILEDLSQEVQTLVADLDRTSDHHISLLEDRISTLSALLDRADRQIDDARMLLEHLQAHPLRKDWAVGARGVSELTPADPGSDADPDSGSGPDSGSDAGASGSTLSEGGSFGDGVSPGTDQRLPAGAVSAPSEQQPGQDTASDQGSDQRAQVIALYNHGLSSDLIAARTGIAIGEVELIISLREKRLWR